MMYYLPFERDMKKVDIILICIDLYNIYLVTHGGQPQIRKQTHTHTQTLSFSHTHLDIHRKLHNAIELKIFAQSPRVFSNWPTEFVINNYSLVSDMEWVWCVVLAYISSINMFTSDFTSNFMNSSLLNY